MNTKAPSYVFVALFGAGYNAVVVRSWWGTAFCVGLAVMFRVGRWLHITKGMRSEELFVACVVLIVMVGNFAWLLAGHPGMP